MLTYQVNVQLITNTTTQTALNVQYRLDKDAYERDVKISAEQIVRLNITPAESHGDLN